MTPTQFCIEPYPRTVLDRRSGVQDGLGVWRRDDEAEVDTLDELLFNEIEHCCQLGIQHMRDRQPSDAQEQFLQALRHLPEPLGRWNAAGWALLALGHVAVTRENWNMARQVLTDAMWSPGVFGNPWAHRLKGQVHLACEERDRAADDLVRAYRAAGQAILEGTAPGCLALIEESLGEDGGLATPSS